MMEILFGALLYGNIQGEEMDYQLSKRTTNVICFSELLMQVANLACTSKCKFLIRLPRPGNKLWMFQFFIYLLCQMQCLRLLGYCTPCQLDPQVRASSKKVQGLKPSVRPKKDLNFSIKIFYWQNCLSSEFQVECLHLNADVKMKQKICRMRRSK